MDEETTALLAQLHNERRSLKQKLAEEQSLFDALAQALLSGPFAGDKHSRRIRRGFMPMYGSSWAAVHDALDAWEYRRKTV
jgi:hypothetical protein